MLRFVRFFQIQFIIFFFQIRFYSRSGPSCSKVGWRNSPDKLLPSGQVLTKQTTWIRLLFAWLYFCFCWPPVALLLILLPSPPLVFFGDSFQTSYVSTWIHLNFGCFSSGKKEKRKTRATNQQSNNNDSKPTNANHSFPGTVNSRLADTPLLRTLVIPDNIQIPGESYRSLTGNDSLYYGLSLLRKYWHFLGTKMTILLLWLSIKRTPGTSRIT